MNKPEWTRADIPSLEGKLAVVTGGNSGIGWHTALELARAGCEVVLTVRTPEKGRDAVDRIHSQLPSAQVRAELLNLASLKSVGEFAGRLTQQPKIDLLVNNAGIMSVPNRRTTEDGFELQLGTNFFGHYALTGLLMPVLLRSPSPRVTTVSSGAANMGKKKIDFDDIQSEKSYDGWKVYCQTKLADLMFADELARRCEASRMPILSDAAHPGYALTNLQTSGRGRPQNLLQRLAALLIAQDAAHGALPTLRAATDPNAVPGAYYAPDGFLNCKGDPIRIPLPKPALDRDSSKRLWELADRLTGSPFAGL